MRPPGARRLHGLIGVYVACWLATSLYGWTALPVHPGQTTTQRLVGSALMGVSWPFYWVGRLRFLHTTPESHHDH